MRLEVKKEEFHSMQITTKWISLALITLATLVSAQAQIQTQSIYGKDNRHDYYEFTQNSPLKQASESTVAFFTKGSVYHNASTHQVYLPSLTLRFSDNVCETERFQNQPAGAFCSGFLVADDLVLTAGHCIETQTECNDARMAFGYRMENANDAAFVRFVSDTDVYSCKEIVHREQSFFGEDWGLIRLDRKVVGHAPLKFQAAKVTGAIQVAALGHPSGLPLKITNEGKIRENYRGNFFTTTLDTFAGNSGSAVVNQATGQVVGILVRGDKDYVWDRNKGCNVSKVYAEGGVFGGEAVTRVSAFLPAVEAAKRSQ